MGESNILIIGVWGWEGKTNILSDCAQKYSKFMKTINSKIQDVQQA